ncbi:MAG: cytochrome P460 family protein [Pseudomonadales bacterium]
MLKHIVNLLVLVALAATASADGARKPTYSSPYDELVDRDGNITVPKNFLTEWVFLGTRTVSRAGELEGWFILIKDTKGRFEGNPLWGDGWGWALFNVDKPAERATQNYRLECTGCHIPALQTDWVYVEGYPHAAAVLNRTRRPMMTACCHRL